MDHLHKPKHVQFALRGGAVAKVHQAPLVAPYPEDIWMLHDYKGTACVTLPQKGVLSLNDYEKLVDVWSEEAFEKNEKLKSEEVRCHHCYMRKQDCLALGPMHALLAIRDEMMVLHCLDAWRITGWDQLHEHVTPKLCSGISVDMYERLTWIDLGDRELEGRVPWKAFLKFPHLAYLLLHNNDFDPSTLPAFMCKLTKLKKLQLTNMNLYGGLPDLSGLHDLQILDVADNEHMSGPIPLTMQGGHLDINAKGTRIGKQDNVKVSFNPPMTPCCFVHRSTILQMRRFPSFELARGGGDIWQVERVMESMRLYAINRTYGRDRAGEVNPGQYMVVGRERCAVVSQKWLGGRRADQEGKEAGGKYHPDDEDNSRLRQLKHLVKEYPDIHFWWSSYWSIPDPIRSKPADRRAAVDAVPYCIKLCSHMFVLLNKWEHEQHEEQEYLEDAWCSMEYLCAMCPLRVEAGEATDYCGRELEGYKLHTHVIRAFDHDDSERPWHARDPQASDAAPPFGLIPSRGETGHGGGLAIQEDALAGLKQNSAKARRKSQQRRASAGPETNKHEEALFGAIGAVSTFLYQQYEERDFYEAMVIQCAWRLFFALKNRAVMEAEKQAELKALFANARREKRAKDDKNKPRQF
jgi:hypothetical protein